MRSAATPAKALWLALLLFQSWSDSLSLGKRRFRLSLLPSSIRSTSNHFQTVNGHASRSQVTTEKTDNLHCYASDVTKVLKILKPETLDPTIPAMFRNKRLTFSNYWTQDDWDRYSSRGRFIRYVRGFPASRLLRRVLPQLLVLVAWSVLAVVFQRKSVLLHRIDVPLTSLSIVSTFVAALQTLRSNQGLTRLKDARIAMAKAVLLTRDTALLFSTYIYPKDKNLGLLAARHLAVFCWLLKAHFRANGQEEQVLHTMLPCKTDSAFIARQRKKPVAVIARLRQIMFDMSERELITTTEHRLIEDNLRGLDDVITTGERIRATPVPPIYVAHATRLMIVYLFFLPIALLGTQLNGVTQVLVTTTVGYAMLGLDEISHIFEEPFRLMPLYQIAKVSMLDVADAFTLQPPALRCNGTDLVVSSSTPIEPQPYW